MGAWLLTRYADVVSLLQDSRFTVDRNQAEYQPTKALQNAMGPLGSASTMATADPPDHARLRGLVSHAFSPRAVGKLHLRIQELVDDLLDAVEDDHRLDVIHDFSWPLPVIVTADMLGMPLKDKAMFLRWSDDFVSFLDGSLDEAQVAQRLSRSALELTDYLRNLIEERRSSPGDDLLSELVAAQEPGNVISEEELLAMWVLILGALKSTTHVVGNGLLALLRNPDQLQQLRDEPSLVEAAVEELIRYDGPFHAIGRIAMEDVELGGQRIRKRQTVLGVLAAANRDPEQFPEPDVLDLRRQDNQHIGFGHGVHFCLGAPLARLEAQIAFRSIVRRWPHLRLETESLEWRPTFLLRGLKRLPVSF